MAGRSQKLRKISKGMTSASGVACIKLGWVSFFSLPQPSLAKLPACTLENTMEKQAETNASKVCK